MNSFVPYWRQREKACNGAFRIVLRRSTPIFQREGLVSPFRVALKGIQNLEGSTTPMLPKSEWCIVFLQGSSDTGYHAISTTIEQLVCIFSVAPDVRSTLEDYLKKCLESKHIL